MKLNIRKLIAVINLKIRVLMNNTSALSAPLMSILMTGLMRIFYTSLSDGDPTKMDFLLGMALNLGLSFNIGMGAIMMTSLPLAEEKEKYTLRALMTSSVNGLEFFLGSLIPPFVISVVTNFIVIFVSGVNIANIDFGMFTLVTVIASLTSCMLGLLIGIFAKNQVNASNILSPFILILSLASTFAQFNDTFEKITSYLYTGIIEKMINTFMIGEHYSLGIKQSTVLLLSLVVITVMFVYFYRENGFEKD